MFRKGGIAIAVATAMVMVAGSVAAANAHFVTGPNVSVGANSITVSGKVAGLGNVPSVNFTLSGELDIFSQCYNKGGKNPAADNKEETLPVNSSGTFPVRNGSTNASFTISPVSTLQCPGNQVVRIESISGTLTWAGGGIIEDIVISFP